MEITIPHLSHSYQLNNFFSSERSSWGTKLRDYRAHVVQYCTGYNPADKEYNGHSLLYIHSVAYASAG